MKIINGSEVKVGDELKISIINGGKGAVVKSLIPYVGLLLSLIGEGSQIASFQGTTIEMTLPAVRHFDLINEA